MTLGGNTLPNPNGFSESNIVTGEYTTTMNGSTRRAIRAVKRVWKLSWNILSEADVTTIKNLFDTETTQTFTFDEITPSISATVHIDIGERIYMAGTSEYLSGVEITLIEA